MTYSDVAETMWSRTGGGERASRPNTAPSAVLVRSVGTDWTPHAPHRERELHARGQPQIPAAAVAAEDANRIVRLTNAGRPRACEARDQRTGGLEGETASANVIGEIIGRERPDEVVLVGGHLDSWDVGTGALR